MKKRGNIRYFLKEGVANFRLHRIMTTAAVMMLAACFLVIGTFGQHGGFELEGFPQRQSVFILLKGNTGG